MQRNSRRPLCDLSNATVSQRSPSKPVSKSRHLSNALPTLSNLDPLQVEEYATEIIDNFICSEENHRPFALGTIQADVNEKMRAILIDWLVDVHLKFKLLPETLYLAVDIIDRYLDRNPVGRQKLQLVGVVSMLLASKYEEIYPPEVKDFVYIAANTYARDEIIRMERSMLQSLEFNLTFPTVFPFLKHGLQLMAAPSQTGLLAHYLAELSLLDFPSLQGLPSLRAASCICLANQLLGHEPWPLSLQTATPYQSADLTATCAQLQTMLRSVPAMKTQAIRKKYSHAKFGGVARLADPQ
eukprot:NODE_2119_length_1274_cov_21.291194_g2015_i0.p1 GENE.NODE_2119_length_1274_cov_21.291194_g2015_i0~~NODE_2119_length_1274_cov_21.291194_g2015_i0.p1  ORF type:complete len:298 (-),score=62.95 NODE_2119_length_1274_cov_21.291194_g2015_i0:356-1249(-)